MKLLVSVALVGGLSLIPDRAEAQCMKWHAFLGPCVFVQNTNPGLCNIPVAQWQWADRRKYFIKYYSDNPQRACENSYINDPYQGPVKARVTPDFPDHAECWIDNNGDNNVQLPEDMPPNMPSPDISHFNIPRLQVPREPQCELVPNGPYTAYVVGPQNPQSGGSFSQGVRDDIKALNATGSPLPGRNVSDAPMDRTDYPVISRFTAIPYEDDYVEDEYGLEPPWGDFTQIDHIIPRKDIHSCPCGTNDPSNAAVISAKHNNLMSNRMDHPGRIEMLLLYTNYVPRPAPGAADLEPSELALDEPVDEAGGCSAASHGSWAGVLLGLALIRRRRR